MCGRARTQLDAPPDVTVFLQSTLGAIDPLPIPGVWVLGGNKHIHVVQRPPPRPPLQVPRPHPHQVCAPVTITRCFVGGEFCVSRPVINRV